MRPFTINGSQTLCFVNVNDLLGFEVGDITTGKMLHRVEVTGYQKGAVKRHGCPSHGIALTPDERELWLADGANSAMHIFDATRDAAEADRDDQAARSARLDHVQHRRQPGLSLDGRDHRYRQTQKIVATLTDENRTIGAKRESAWRWCSPTARSSRTGDQFGIGRVAARSTALPAAR